MQMPRFSKHMTFDFAYRQPSLGMLPWNKKEETCSPYVDGALLLLRLGAGGLMAGHGAQKLFGWFGGHGLHGTGMWLESMGLKPGKTWALAAGAGEMGGGVLTALGLGGPVGAIGTISAMSMATAKAHWGKPIWVTEGGAELPVLYSTVAGALALAGPGRYSLDRALGIKMHWAIPALAAALAGAAVAYGAMSRPEPAEQPVEQPQQPEEPQEPAEQREPTPMYQERHAAA
jgi:putative oxidoreductase